MIFPDGFVDEVRRVADIVQVISERVSLRRMGHSWKGLCPFHQEKTPSFNVRTDPAIFHCFGCGAGGDVFKFLMLHEKLSFPEAIETLARRFGVPVPEGPTEKGPNRREREALLELLDAVAEHFARNLWSAAGAGARDYLLGRGLKKETLERVRAGAARESWDDVLQAFRGRFGVEALVAAGLLGARPSGDGHYDRFRNRAVFPIFDEAGKVVAFGARSIDGSDPKYLNSPETVVYQKSRVLYGLSWSREALRKGAHAVLMEGYLDVARALEGGVVGAVATCGTALTPAHARLLRRLTPAVVVNFDEDEAGRKAARKAIDLLLAEGLGIRVVDLPEGHDPDSFIRAEGGQAYEKRLTEAPEAVEWLIRTAQKGVDLDSPSGKAAYLNAILPTLARIESAVERAAWVARAAERGGLDETAAREEMKKVLAGRSAGPVPGTPLPRTGDVGPILHAESWLLASALAGTEGVDEALALLDDDDLASLASAEALKTARRLRQAQGSLTPAALLEALADEESRRVVTSLTVSSPPAEALGSPRECALGIKRRRLDQRLAALRRSLGGAEDDRLLEEMNRLARAQAALV
jgi:DNA primase